MVYCVTTGEMHGFSHQNPLYELSVSFSTILLFLLVPKFIDSLEEKTKNPDNLNSFFKKEKPIPGTLEFKAKYIKRRRVNGCNFIKNKKYKYILGKSMPPYINFSLFLIISSKNPISESKILAKGAATVVFAQGPSFKKDHTLLDLHGMLRLCCFINLSLLLVKLSLFSKIKLNSSFFIRGKNIFKSFIFLWNMYI